MEQQSPSHESISEQLGKVLVSKQFAGMERSSTLLRFLVRQALDGKGARVKEYTVATEALGRSESFDPRADTIVRAEVSRLRSRLKQYYATDGKSDPLVIELPRGSYVPLFHDRAP